MLGTAHPLSQQELKTEKSDAGGRTRDQRCTDTTNAQKRSCVCLRVLRFLKSDVDLCIRWIRCLSFFYPL